MPKPTKEPEKKELPPRYPRTEEILIFDSMGDIDIIFEEINFLGESLCNLPYKCSHKQWKDEFIDSRTRYLTYYLRRACTEFERFNRTDNWKPDDDKNFMACMNDSDELWWLVNDLESGIWGEVNGVVTRIYDPSYHSAARSLQICMYFEEITGDHDWINACIDQLKQFLMRYHVASLEIVMHRGNVYLDNNIKSLEIVRKMRERSLKRAKEQKAESSTRAAEVLACFNALYRNKQPKLSKTFIVNKTAVETGVAVSTVWRYLGKIK